MTGKKYSDKRFGLYYCECCKWSGKALDYDESGDGRCPVCGVLFQGCVSPQKYEELTGN